MKNLDYNKSTFDCCAYYSKAESSSTIYLVLYVEDMLIATKNKSDIQNLKGHLSAEFETKNLSTTSKNLGMEIYRDRSKKKKYFFLSQKGYIQNILSRFGMFTTKAMNNQCAVNIYSSIAFAPKTAEEMEYMSRSPYSSVVGSIMYAMVCTRPDLAQAISVVSKFMAKLGKEYWQTVKRILRYLRGMFDIGLIYGSDTQCLVQGFLDSDYA